MLLRMTTRPSATMSLPRMASRIMAKTALLAREIGLPQFQRRAWIIIEEEVGVWNEVIFVQAEFRLGLISALLLKPDRKAHIVPCNMFQHLLVSEEDTLRSHNYPSLPLTPRSILHSKRVRTHRPRC
jgi:hypothetical protein